MRRREKVSRNGRLPTKLATFNRAEWVGRDEAERYGAWIGARHKWGDARGIIELPGDQEAWAAFPDGEFRHEDI